MKKKKVSHQQKEPDLYSYIEDIKRWQTNQYLPGAYLGGDIHPVFRSKTKFGGLLLFVSGLVLLSGSVYSGVQLVSGSSVERANALSNFLFLLIVGSLSLFVGWKFLFRLRK